MVCIIIRYLFNRNGLLALGHMVMGGTQGNYNPVHLREVCVCGREGDSGSLYFLLTARFMIALIIIITMFMSDHRVFFIKLYYY